MRLSKKLFLHMLFVYVYGVADTAGNFISSRIEMKLSPPVSMVEERLYGD
jgi:hypothetical protein